MYVGWSHVDFMRIVVKSLMTVWIHLRRFSEKNSSWLLRAFYAFQVRRNFLICISSSKKFYEMTPSNILCISLLKKKFEMILSSILCISILKKNFEMTPSGSLPSRNILI
uniref:Uncharacterized protein n=1 Tax=Cacopsylla melanoneura TaxID=428564 RepID=A0A8D8T235_9HEMI